MSPLFRRDKSASDADPAPEPVPVALRKGESAAKGRPTPKRSEVLKRRAPEPPPKDNKEARRRMREKMRLERAERFEGAQRGEDQYLLARDRGPVRRLARDIIDSRRNVGPLFLCGLLVVVVFTTSVFPPQVRIGANLLWVGLLLLLGIDLVLIGRRVAKLVPKRFPGTTEKTGSLIFYAALRSTMPRRFRTPRAQIPRGTEL